MGVGMTEDNEKQLLHLVFGGELTSVEDITFKDLSKLDIVGIYPNFATAHAALESARAADSRQRADALLYRPSAPPARPAHHLTPRHERCSALSAKKKHPSRAKGSTWSGRSPPRDAMPERWRRGA